MDLKEHKVRKFLPMFDRVEPAIQDSTAIQTAKACKRKYFYRFVLGFAPQIKAPYFVWGSAIHLFWELIHKSNGDFQSANTAALNYWNKHNGDLLAKGMTKFDFMTAARLQMSLYEMWKYYKQQIARKKIEVMMSEQPFDVMIPGTDIRIGGRADQIIRMDGMVWGLDVKTTSKKIDFYERSLEPNDQFTRYVFAESQLCGETIKGIIVLVVRNNKDKTLPGPEIVPLMTTRTKWQIEKWVAEQITFNKILDICREDDEWPMEESQCPWCDYRMVCRSGNENQMVTKLREGFIFSPWDFTNIENEASND